MTTTDLEGLTALVAGGAPGIGIGATGSIEDTGTALAVDGGMAGLRVRPEVRP
ncbi:hypothetical protein [Streptomyces sp. SAS_270]|uniref:hypothetical protein n=1 Tax=Streptomyces sp. SAS_270 TaxID=3412748 RepID=UPI00403CD9BC